MCENKPATFSRLIIISFTPILINNEELLLWTKLLT